MWFRNIFRTDKNAPSIPGTQPSQAEGASVEQNDILLPAHAVRQLDHLQLNASRFLPGARVGLRPSPRRRPAAEFREHRMYVPGDDIRYVDWKASARQEHIYIKQGEEPKDALIYLLVDCSASMTWAGNTVKRPLTQVKVSPGDYSKRSATLSLAAALGYLALAHSDRLFVQPLSAGLQPPLGPLSGKGQVLNLVNYLQSLPFGGKVDLAHSVQNFTRRVHRGGMLLVITDMLETPDLGAVLDLVPAPTWDVLLFHMLHPQEIMPEVRGDYELLDSETGQAANYDIDQIAVQTYLARLDTWQKSLEQAAVDHNAFYTVISSGWSLEREVLSHLHTTHVVRPL